jgi:adenylate cyclase
MDFSHRLGLMNWLVSQGLSGAAGSDLIRGFCERCRGHGLPLSRGVIFIDTLHPIFEGRGFRWNDIEIDESDVFEYGSTARAMPRKTGGVRPSIMYSSMARTRC